MKRIIFSLFFAVFITAFSLTAYAADNSDGVSITVVIPNAVKETPPPTPPPAPKNYLYPVSVWESVENGRREIIRTYELAPHERPQDISRESFTRDGVLYELADITRKETANADVRDHTENISVDTQTNDMAAILRLLAPTMEYQSDDGYIGFLQLDIASIKVEQAGTRSSSYTVSATREYPHLSSNDTGLVPKTITDNGRTLTLESINWKTQNYSTVDYSQIPDSYTAIATYTGTASRTTVTGYITTAEYNGVISKILTGKTVYTAYFIGVPIVSGIVNRPSEPTATTAPETVVTEQPTEETPCETPTEPTITEPTTEPPTETATPTETLPPETTETPVETETEQKPNNLLFLLLAVLLGGAGFGGAFAYVYFQKIKKPKVDKPIEKEDTPYEDEDID